MWQQLRPIDRCWCRRRSSGSSRGQGTAQRGGSGGSASLCAFGGGHGVFVSACRRGGVGTGVVMSLIEGVGCCSILQWWCCGGGPGGDGDGCGGGAVRRWPVGTAVGMLGAYEQAEAPAETMGLVRRRGLALCVRELVAEVARWEG